MSKWMLNGMVQVEQGASSTRTSLGLDELQGTARLSLGMRK